MSLGTRLKEAREAKNLKQSELAAMIGVNSGAVISNWEKDINKPDVEKLPSLCESLEVDITYLLDFNAEVNFTVAPTEIDRIKKYRNLDQYGKKAVDVILDVEHTRTHEQSQTRHVQAPRYRLADEQPPAPPMDDAAR
jgi:transcriptional regulator with XRE-family HTH domain